MSTEQMKVDDRLLTREQAAKFLSISESALSQWASSGRNELPYVKIGRSVRYRRQDLESWLEQRQRTQV